MQNRKQRLWLMSGRLAAAAALLVLTPLYAFSFGTTVGKYTLSPGHASLQEWMLPAVPPYPANNEPTPARVALGKMLFFEPRVSSDNNMSCATCHNPLFGWSDGMPTGKGHKSQVLGRATPTVINTAYNFIQMWDGRKATLEDQATGPMEASVEMNTDFDQLIGLLRNNDAYRAAFEQAYPGEEISADTVARAIASFERTVISNDSPFDRWVRGEANAMTRQQVRGFEVFLDENKGNCVVCHSPPNFTDDGFHNVGLDSWDSKTPDMGRFAHKPIKVLKGAFKTPTLRDVALTAPYFHDGSAVGLMEVVEHYEKGGAVKSNLSPNIKALRLTQRDKVDLVAFMHALTSDHEPFVLPVLPVIEPSLQAIKSGKKNGYASAGE